MVLFDECPEPALPDGFETVRDIRQYAVLITRLMVSYQEQLGKCNADKKAARKWYEEMRKLGTRMTDPRWLDACSEGFVQLVEQLPQKMAISIPLTSLCAMIGIDAPLLYACFATLTADIVVRGIVLYKRNRPLCRGAKRAIPRYCFYMAFIAIAWTAQFSIERATGVRIPFGVLAMRKPLVLSSGPEREPIEKPALLMCV